MLTCNAFIAYKHKYCFKCDVFLSNEESLVPKVCKYKYFSYKYYYSFILMSHFNKNNKFKLKTIERKLHFLFTNTCKGNS